MKSDYTHIAIVLDRSGSMDSIRKDTIGGFNTFLKTQQAAPGSCTLTLVQFDSQAIEMVVPAFPINLVVPLSEKNYIPRANTPLYDAVGQTIEDTGKFLKSTPEHQRPGKVVFVIITDGLENASRQFNAQRVRQMIEHQRDVYKWEFIFLGANIDSYAVTEDIGILRTHTMNYAHNTGGVICAFAAVADNTAKFRDGSKRSMAYEAKQRAEQKDAGAAE